MNLFRQLAVLFRLYKNRADNPLLQSYHFGYRVGARGWAFHALRVALVVFPVCLMLACSVAAGSSDEATLYYLGASAVYLLALPVVCLQVFGVRRLDPQVLEELSLTRLDPRELVFGMYYWPVMTSFFGLIPLFAVQVYFLMFSEYSIHIGLWIAFHSCLYAGLWISGTAIVLRHWHMPGGHRLAWIIVQGAVSAALLIVLLVLVRFLIRMNETLRYESWLMMACPVGFLVASAGRLADLFTGAVARVFAPSESVRESASSNPLPALRMLVLAIPAPLLLIFLLAQAASGIHDPDFLAERLPDVTNRGRVFAHYSLQGYTFLLEKSQSPDYHTGLLRGLCGWNALMAWVIMGSLLAALRARGYLGGVRLPLSRRDVLIHAVVFSAVVGAVGFVISGLGNDGPFEAGWNLGRLPAQFALFLACGAPVVAAAVLLTVLLARRPVRAAAFILLGALIIYFVPLLTMHYSAHDGTRGAIVYNLRWSGLAFIHPVIVCIGYFACGGVGALMTQAIRQGAISSQISR